MKCPVRERKLSAIAIYDTARANEAYLINEKNRGATVSELSKIRSGWKNTEHTIATIANNGRRTMFAFGCGP